MRADAPAEKWDERKVQKMKETMKDRGQWWSLWGHWYFLITSLSLCLHGPSAIIFCQPCLGGKRLSLSHHLFLARLLRSCPPTTVQVNCTSDRSNSYLLDFCSPSVHPSIHAYTVRGGTSCCDISPCLKPPVWQECKPQIAFCLTHPSSLPEAHKATVGWDRRL